MKQKKMKKRLPFIAALFVVALAILPLLPPRFLPIRSPEFVSISISITREDGIMRKPASTEEMPSDGPSTLELAKNELQEVSREMWKLERKKRKTGTDRLRYRELESQKYKLLQLTKKIEERARVEQDEETRNKWQEYDEKAQVQWRRQQEKTLDECTEIRPDQGDGSMKQSPVRSQGRIGNCYAMMAAQIVDGWRFFHGDQDFEHVTSAFALSVDYTAEFEEGVKDISAIKGGYTRKALETALGSGSCSMSTSTVNKYIYQQRGAFRCLV